MLALIPLAGEVFWAPMALAMMGGLVAATILTLTFLPALYALAFKIPLPGRSEAAPAVEERCPGAGKHRLAAAAQREALGATSMRYCLGNAGSSAATSGAVPQGRSWIGLAAREREREALSDQKRWKLSLPSAAVVVSARSGHQRSRP